jgi:hypothetical protein
MKAIETMYNGYRFRSRLEARWAVFFDTLGIQYEYEKEGYRTNAGGYLPDFWLPQLQCHFEVKPDQISTGEFLKMRELARKDGHRLYIVRGEIKIPIAREDALSPYHKGTWMSCYLPQEQICNQDSSRDDGWIYPDLVLQFWCECPSCSKIEITEDGKTRTLSCRHYSQGVRLWDDDGESYTGQQGHDIEYGYDSPRLIAAYTAARQARFEHGKRGR